MNEATWTAVDHFFADQILHGDAALDAALEANRAGGLPAIDVSPLQGKLLHLIAKIAHAATALEVGTLGGYSTIWLARGVTGRVTTLELEAKHAEVARGNLARAGLADRVDVQVGRAVDLLDAMVAARHAPFDLVFIDADKQSNPLYFARALELTREGSIIIVDNVVRSGRVTDASSTDPAIVGTRALIAAIAAEPRVSATAIQTVGTKGYDGFTICHRIG